MWTFFILSSIAICISIVLLIRRYAGQDVEVIVKIATAYAWLTSMCIVALVPFDVWTSLAGENSGKSFVGVLWSVAYWSTQLATWLVLPFYQVYSEAGDFSVKERAWTSIKENAILYGLVGGLGVIGIAGLLIAKAIDINSLAGLGVGLSNAFGLIAGLLLLGYGLVEIPRQVWKGSDPEICLKWAAHRSGKFAEDVMRARVELRDVITIIYANQRQMRRHDPLMKYMEIVFENAEKHSPIKPSDLASRTVDIDHLRAEDLEYNYDKAGLAALRRRLTWAIWEYRGAHARYADVVKEALQWENVVKARTHGNYIQPLSLRGEKPKWWEQVSWLYDTKLRAQANKVIAALLVVASLCIVWGEITIPVNQPDMSPFSLLIKSVDKGDEFLVQLFTILPLVYICASMYYTLFRINAFNYNKLIARATTGAGLMQNGSLMCRFAAPTCWNYFHIIHMTKEFCPKGQHCVKTVFDDKMASLSILPSFMNINKYLPVILAVHCGITALDLWDKLLNCCTNSKYKFSTDDVEDIYTEKGRLLIRKEAEAVSKGYRIGDVLATAYVDLQFPAVKGMERDLPQGQGGQPSKGLWSSLFGRKAIEPELPPVPQEIKQPGRPYKSAAAQAASRWLTGNRAGASSNDDTASTLSTPTGSAAAGNASGQHVMEMQTENTQRLSLLFSRMDNSSSPVGGHGGAGGSSFGSSVSHQQEAGSGLDGIFASLGASGGGGAAFGPSRLGAASTGPGLGPNRSGAAAAEGMSGSGAPPPSRPAAKSDLDSLLGGLWKSG